MCNITPIGVSVSRALVKPGMIEVLLTFPARDLKPGERTVLAKWLGRAGDIALACERRSNDPALFRRIVIIRRHGYPPSHLIHAPTDIPCWLVCSTGQRPRVKQFDTLHAALNFVRPVFFSDG
jgi:hypothetical protein